ncbi:ATP-binding protein [Pseudonocardia xishanensis]|uniref:AAA family ATPase n=1 Tax=Pseudonocardia xishanensis TaxID=630995 RepID=A0ABP8S4N8_9PSEU
MLLREREHALDLLETHARSAVRGCGSVVLVTGEAGIGKTVLLRELVERTRSAAGSLWGMCDPLSTPRPLGPLRDVARALGGGVPELLRAGADQHEVFATVVDALRGRPRVFVVEDLHWADEATLDLVRFLARRIEALPLLLVLSFREPLPPDNPLVPVLGDLVASAGAGRVSLAPLSVEAVAALLDRDERDAAEVHRRTAGNPFFVSQIAAQPDSPLPGSVRDAVLARIAGLAPFARHCLELLSCTPEPVGRELLAALDMTPTTVGVLCATGLVDRRGHGVVFRHEIARSAVLEAAAPGSEPALHAAMTTALEAVDADLSVLAHHAAAAGDTARILRYASAAAVEASRSGAHRESVSFFETALRVAEDPATRAGLLEAVADEYYLTDRLGSAIGARERALELRRGLDDAVAVGSGHSALSNYAWYSADRAAAERHDEAALEILAAAGDRWALGMTLAHHAFLAAQRGDVDEAQRSVEAATRIADELDDSRGAAVLRGAARLGRGVTRLANGEVAGREDLLAAAEAGLRHRDDDLTTTPMSNLCAFDVAQGRFAEAEVSVARALEVSEDRDTPICSAWQRGVRARLRLLQGRWAEAERDARTVLRSGDLPLSQLWPNLVLGLLLARREAPRHNPYLDELWRLASKLDTPGVVGPAAAALAENAWITRTPDPRLDRPPFAEAPGLAVWTRRLTGEPGPAEPPSVLPYERALALWDSGSGEDLLAALAAVDELGAKAVADLVRARLREAGVSGIPRGRQPATRANPAGLTARQLDVLALLVDGLTNADIATRLVISPRTADHHVSAILAKLEVHTRAEAAAAAVRLGVTTASRAAG